MNGIPPTPAPAPTVSEIPVASRPPMHSSHAQGQELLSALKEALGHESTGGPQKVEQPTNTGLSCAENKMNDNITSPPNSGALTQSNAPHSTVGDQGLEGRFGTLEGELRQVHRLLRELAETTLRETNDKGVITFTHRQTTKGVQTVRATQFPPLHWHGYLKWSNQAFFRRQLTW